MLSDFIKKVDGEDDSDKDNEALEALINGAGDPSPNYHPASFYHSIP